MCVRLAEARPLPARVLLLLRPSPFRPKQRRTGPQHYL